MDLVTGGSGFIGSHLVDRLLSHGRRVRIYDRGTDDRHRLALERWGDRVEVLHGDVRDATGVAEAVRGAERVFHLASLGGVRRSMREPELYQQINVGGTVHVLEALRPDQRLIYVSSSSVYGEVDRPSRETDPLRPASPYAQSKADAEARVREWSGDHVAIVRPFTVYGPRQRPSMAMSLFLRAARTGTPVTVFGDGSASRDHTFVSDVVDVLVGAAGVDGFSVFNAGAGTTVSLLDLLAVIEAVTGRALARVYAEPQPGDVHRTWSDRSHAATTLGLGPPVPLAEGIRIVGLST